MPVAKINGIHDFRNTVAAGLGRKFFHKEKDDSTANDRRQDDPCAKRAGRRWHIRIIRAREFAQKENVVDKSDQPAQKNGA